MVMMVTGCGCNTPRPGEWEGWRSPSCHAHLTPREPRQTEKQHATYEPYELQARSNSSHAQINRYQKVPYGALTINIYKREG